MSRAGWHGASREALSITDSTVIIAIFSNTIFTFSISIAFITVITLIIITVIITIYFIIIVPFIVIVSSIIATFLSSAEVAVKVQRLKKGNEAWVRRSVKQNSGGVEEQLEKDDGRTLHAKMINVKLVDVSGEGSDSFDLEVNVHASDTRVEMSLVVDEKECLK